MIDSFFIKNFKNIKLLELQGFKRLNLFTGKNNTGKSTLLEAIALYVNDGDISIITQLLLERGEIIEQRGPNSKNPLRKRDADVLASLFTNRKIGYDFINDSILLSEIKPNLFDEVENTENELRIGFVRFVDERTVTKDGEINKRKFISHGNGSIQNEDEVKIGLQIISNDKTNIIPIGENDLYRKLYRRYNMSEESGHQSFQFIKSGTVNTESSRYLWDQIALTEKEQFVIEALQIIEPNIQRIAFIGETPRDRTAVVKTKGNEKVVPLKGMGDGINRILTIILAAVNSDNGYLLIDEFENGLHFSVQEQLWSILIRLSLSLKIQIFVTTHSNDCIDGFENALEKAKKTSMGRLFRLEGNEKTIMNAVKFDINEVKIATEESIEIR